MSEAFRKFAQVVSRVTGSASVFLVALTVVIVWAITGPLFGFSDTWQLVINTGTTIVTFLMVFLIQNTQNRDSQALHAKLDDLLIAVQGADNGLVDAEDLSDEELKRVKEHLHEVANKSPNSSQAEAKTATTLPIVKETETNRSGG
ncbi:MAG TPA: low affinity iron permease family protein [Dehalococcoidia bacterium]|nr:low affinity iron permease family protein [Dehalococcoidia bacterium]